MPYIVQIEFDLYLNGHGPDGRTSVPDWAKRFKTLAHATRAINKFTKSKPSDEIIGGITLYYVA